MEVEGSNMSHTVSWQRSTPSGTPNLASSAGCTLLSPPQIRPGNTVLGSGFGAKLVSLDQRRQSWSKYRAVGSQRIAEVGKKPVGVAM